MASKKLSAYRTKRDFSRTTEPSGMHPVKPSKRLRYVIQKHAARQLHYDLRLELDGVFRSWAVTRGPSLTPEQKRLAVEVEDHPLDYGDFEGTIPKGQYGGGTVQIWDRGYWTPETGEKPGVQLDRGELKFTLDGERLHGSWVLVRMKGDRYGGKRAPWLLIKHRDAHARDAEDSAALLEQDRSVASGRRMADIAAGRGRPPRPFMLASQALARSDAIWTPAPDDGTGANTRHNAGKRTTGKTGGMYRTQRAASNSSHGRTGQKTAVGRASTTTGVRSSTSRSRAAARSTSTRGSRMRLPAFIEPELCKLAERPPTGPGWAHEIKLDGYRLQLRVENHRAALKTRKGLDWSERFQAIGAAARNLPDCIIDGEVVALDKRGSSDFGAMQAALSEQNTDDLVFFAFDLLNLQGKDLRSMDLRERKQALQSLLEMPAHRNAPLLRYSSHVEADGKAVLDEACRMHLEGIISKRLDAPYRSGRVGDWVKTKCRVGHEVVIGGWTHQSGQLRSLLMGVYRADRLVPVGRVGTGFNRRTAQALRDRLEPLARSSSPFEGGDAPRGPGHVQWVEPRLVAEIEFAGWTPGGNVRQGAFKGLREDKLATEVMAELPASNRSTSDLARSSSRAVARSASPKRAASKNAGSMPGAIVRGVTISHPDKVLWPRTSSTEAVTKLDLARYFESVDSWMMEHLQGRPCSIVRAPDGIDHETFFQRHAMPGTPRQLTLTRISGDRKPYLQIDEPEALAALAQVATTELHPWNCLPDLPEVPGRLVFDLDPGPDVRFDAVVAAAKEMKQRLESLGLAAYCKTTGGKGLHVVTPLSAPDGRHSPDWKEAKAFAKGVCVQMAQDSPSRYVVNMAKKLRTGRIFLDYLRNDRMSTAVAPLSPRARPGAPVSMPLNWTQVRVGLDPQRYTLRSAPTLIARSTAWKDYRDNARPLESAIRKLLEAHDAHAARETRDTRRRGASSTRRRRDSGSRQPPASH